MKHLVFDPLSGGSHPEDLLLALLLLLRPLLKGGEEHELGGEVLAVHRDGLVFRGLVVAPNDVRWDVFGGAGGEGDPGELDMGPKVLEWKIVVRT